VRRIGILGIGGVTAIAAATCFIASVILELVSPSTGLPFDELLASVGDDALYVTSIWLAVLAYILSLPAILAVLHVMRYVGSLIWLPVLTYTLGIGLAFVEAALRLGVVYELSERFADASGETATALEAVARTTASSGSVLVSIGGLLAVTIGIGLLSITILFLSDLPPRWLGWLGVAIAGLGVVVFAPLFIPYLFEVMGIGLVAWFAGLGVWLIGLREPLESQ
jgi:hypothetical protein